MKKNIVILGGNTSNNLDWLKKIKNLYKTDNVYELAYTHWNTDKELDFELELSKLKDIVEEIDDYVIIAKSVGSIISLMGIKEGFLKPSKLMILGFPLGYIKRKNVDIEPLINNGIKKTKIMVIQQKNDPIGTYDDVRNILSDVIKVNRIPGHYHIYSNFKVIKPILDEFMN